jgi:uncharacterized protein YycO
MTETKYSDIRKSIRTGDLLAWKNPNKSDKASSVLWWYQKIFKANYTHVAIAVKIGKRYFVVEATPPAVRIYPISLLDDFDLIRTDIDLSRGKQSKYIDILFRELGKPYSLTDLFRNTIGMSNNKSNRYCSQLAAFFYKEVGLVDDVIEAGYTPDMLVGTIIEVTGNEPISVKIDRGNLYAI